MPIVESALLRASATMMTAQRRDYVAVWQVITDAATDGPILVSGALPGIGTAYGDVAAGFPASFSDGDAFSTVQGYSGIQLAEANRSRNKWVAQVMYSTESQDRCQTDLGIDPLSLPPVISGGGTRETAGVELDINDEPVANAANEQFTDFTRDWSRQRLTIRQNQSTINRVQWDDFANKLNESTFFGLPGGSWKMEMPEYEERFQGACSRYYEVVYTFLSDPFKWELRPPNVGWRVLRDEGAGLVLTDPVGEDGKTKSVPSAPVKLKADGTQGFKDDPLIFFNGEPGSAGPPFKIYATRDFSLLGIPTSD